MQMEFKHKPLKREVLWSTQLQIPLKVLSKFKADTVKTSSFNIVSNWGPKDKGKTVSTIFENFGYGLKS